MHQNTRRGGNLEGVEHGSIMGNSRQFKIDIGSELNLAVGELRAVVGKTALEGLRRIVLRTPVDTGRARGNWFVSFGTAGTETTQGVDPNGSATIARGAAVISRYKTRRAFDSILLYNNLPYINRLEDGYSTQAPGGMVALTVAELQLRPVAS